MFPHLEKGFNFSLLPRFTALILLSDTWEEIEENSCTSQLKHWNYWDIMPAQQAEVCISYLCHSGFEPGSLGHGSESDPCGSSSSFQPPFHLPIFSITWMRQQKDQQNRSLKRFWADGLSIGIQMLPWQQYEQLDTKIKSLHSCDNNSKRRGKEVSNLC